MLRQFTWNVLPADPARASALARRCGIDPLSAQLLLNRGISEPSEVQRFLSPTLQALEDPLVLPEMAKAVSRIRQAIATREMILVFGDADVDGITASAILYESLTLHGAKVVVRLSNRLEDGYGFPRSLIKRLVRAGFTLLILVDCGTNQPDEIDALAREGIDTIVLDHHVPMDRQARPLALVNPARGDRAGRELSSAGLAWKLAQAMRPRDVTTLSRFLDLATLGTLADCSPLVGENRILVSMGLGHVRTTQRLGLARVCEAVRLTEASPAQILRRLVPRLNAAGRLGNPRPVWKLLVESREPVVNRLAQHLERAHTETKALHRRILLEAHEQANRLHFKHAWVMVVGRRDWHPGLMGPVASQLVERYARPAIAIALDRRIGVGSGRSIAAFNLLEALRVCEGLLVRYGGHPQACGLTISAGNVERFRESINQHVQDSGGRHRFIRTLAVDLEVRLRDLTTRFASTVERFAPFGRGNPRPALLIRKLAVEACAPGRTWVTDGATRVRVRDRRGALVPSERYDLVASPALDGGELVLSICDVRLSTEHDVAHAPCP
jgi:single-stranded-DNA-specific exonuclease